MSLAEFDVDEFKRICRAEKEIEDVHSFYRNGVSVEIIAKSLNMTVEQVNEILKEPVSEQC